MVAGTPARNVLATVTIAVVDREPVDTVGAPDEGGEPFGRLRPLGLLAVLLELVESA